VKLRFLMDRAAALTTIAICRIPTAPRHAKHVSDACPSTQKTHHSRTKVGRRKKPFRLDTPNIHHERKTNALRLLRQSIGNATTAATRTTGAKTTLRRRTCFFGASFPLDIIRNGFGRSFRLCRPVVAQTLQERQASPEEQRGEEQ